MSGQGRPDGEAGKALLTLVRFVAGICRKKRSKGITRLFGLSTKRRVLTGVHVIEQERLLLESGRALVAFERLLARVVPHVHL